MWSRRSIPRHKCSDRWTNGDASHIYLGTDTQKTKSLSTSMCKMSWRRACWLYRYRRISGFIWFYRLGELIYIRDAIFDVINIFNFYSTIIHNRLTIDTNLHPSIYTFQLNILLRPSPPPSDAIRRVSRNTHGIPFRRRRLRWRIMICGRPIGKRAKRLWCVPRAIDAEMH